MMLMTQTKKMAEVTSDDEWKCQQAIKVLTLEHHMAARRGGFDGFFEPLYKVDSFKTGLLDGTLSGIALYAQQVLPLVQAMQSKDEFVVARIVKDHSAIMAPERQSGTKISLEEVRKAGRAVKSMFSLCNNSEVPVLLDVLKVIHREDPFVIPEIFKPILTDLHRQREWAESVPEYAEDDKNPEIDAWREVLTVSFSQFEAYAEYIFDRSQFGTHQGTKGLQFPRVMVILDDNESRGFMFSYEKLFGAKVLTKTDEKNFSEGKDTSVGRTRRLFYVTCRRAQRSLAVIFYTSPKNA